jgi:hypothetical protein
MHKKTRAHTAVSLSHDTHLYYLPQMSFDIIKIWCAESCASFLKVSKQRINWEIDRTHFVDDVKKSTNGLKTVFRPQSVLQQLIDGPSIELEERPPSPEKVIPPSSEDKRPASKVRMYRKEPAGGTSSAYRIVYEHDPNRVVHEPKLVLDLKTIMGTRIFIKSRTERRPSVLMKSNSPFRSRSGSRDKMKPKKPLLSQRKIPKMNIEKKPYNEVEHIQSFTSEIVKRLRN